jgi:hypothetical protein
MIVVPNAGLVTSEVPQLADSLYATRKSAEMGR